MIIDCKDVKKVVLMFVVQVVLEQMFGYFLFQLMLIECEEECLVV